MSTKTDFKCQFCASYFHNQSNLNKHYKRVHNNAPVPQVNDATNDYPQINKYRRIDHGQIFEREEIIFKQFSHDELLECGSSCDIEPTNRTSIDELMFGEDVNECSPTREKGSTRTMIQDEFMEMLDYSSELRSDSRSSNTNCTESNRGTSSVNSSSYFSDDELHSEIQFSTFEELADTMHSDRVEKRPDIPIAAETLFSLIKENDLSPNMFDKIIDWAVDSKTKHKTDFESKDLFPSYQTVLKRIERSYGILSGGPPIETLVEMKDYSDIENVTLDHFNLLKTLQMVYADKNIINSDSLWSYDSNASSFTDINTGHAWKFGEERLANKLDPINNKIPDGHFFAPQILFIDGTFVDNKGKMEAEVVMIAPANASLSKRKKAQTWQVLGYLPSYPKSKAQRQKERNRNSSKNKEAEFYQQCLKCLLQPLMDLSKSNEGQEIYVYGKGIVTLHFDLLLIIGDTKGADKLTGHYSASSAVIKRMVRDCNIPTTLGDDADYKCCFTQVLQTKNTVQTALQRVKDKNGSYSANETPCREISQNMIDVFFWNFDFGGTDHGVHCACPYEELHLLYLGLFKYLLQSIYEYREPNLDLLLWHNARISKKEKGSLHKRPGSHGAFERRKENLLPIKFNTAEFERRAFVTAIAARRQSDRAMPRMAFTKGITNLSRLNGQEYVGLMILTMVALPHMITSKTSSDYSKKAEREFIQLLWTSICLAETLTREMIPKEELDVLHRQIKSYLKKYHSVVGIQREQVSLTGLRIPKFHDLLHYPFYIRMYGSPLNFSGVFLESALRPNVKQFTVRTTRRHSSFKKELLCREYESRLCRTARHQRVMQGYCNNEFCHNVRPRASGEDENTFGNIKVGKPCFIIKKIGIGKYETTSSQNLRFDYLVHPEKLDEEGLSWIKEARDLMETNECNQMKCFLKCDLIDASSFEHQILRCNPAFLKSEWRDWVMVKWKRRNGTTYQNAAQLCLIFSISKRNDSLFKEKLYIVVHPLKSSGNPVMHKALYGCRIDERDQELQCIESSSIESVVTVLPSCGAPNQDFGEPNQAFPNDQSLNRHFIIIPPRANWHSFFKHMV